ncbi:MAG: alpha/beta hydrolase [Gammaproteobacteria bacterium]|nr:alpha/beta hydrolase [Gammaproteobacteria bacterium]
MSSIEKIIENEQDNPRIVGIVCHPHPLQGGTMNNKVVTTLTRVIREFGGTAIRFNYRKFDHGIGELQDTLEIVQFAQKKWPEAELWLAGFSYGAYLSLKAATQAQDIKQLISVAPAVNHMNFSGLHPHCPWIVVVAEDDEVVPAQDIKQWIQTLNPQPTVLDFENTSHFFHGKLIQLRDILLETLQYAHPR